MTDIIFESFINLFQSVVVTEFLIISLGCKDKYNKKCVSAAGILITFIYLTVSNHIVFFESAGIYIYMVCSLIFSFLVLGGNVIEKIFYNIMMLLSILYLICLLCVKNLTFVFLYYIYLQKSLKKNMINAFS